MRGFIGKEPIVATPVQAVIDVSVACTASARQSGDDCTTCVCPQALVSAAWVISVCRLEECLNSSASCLERGGVGGGGGGEGQW